ncbi:putative 2-hydroxyacid dehydrogenase [Venturia nashicola]|uniref:Putative 2-hydroxyacid dehydrogenase n=1 Tax=Venturia nashicola TaxID=86259 RepID=A0A4Z1P3G0_9PEZI|nr:putative 2-hydroxyacid dehydrogenase [Venturia nashicola]
MSVASAVKTGQSSKATTSPALLYPTHPNYTRPTTAVIAAEPKTIEGHYTIYRLALHWRILELCNEESGKVDFQADGSAPGDFSGRKLVTYWTPEKETVDKYLGFYRRTNRNEPYSILVMYVPSPWVDMRLSRFQYKDPRSSIRAPIAEWYPIVSASRAGQEWPGPQLKAKFDSSDLIMGPILNGCAKKYENYLAQPRDITNNDCLFIELQDEPERGEVHAQQWVFTDRVEDQFNENCHKLGRIIQMGTTKIAFEKE